MIKAYVSRMERHSTTIMSLSSTSRALGRAPSRAISSALRAATRSNNLGRAVATRAYSTGSQGSHSSSSKAPLWGLAALNIGLGGYWLASQDATSTNTASPQYGTTQDFARAIEELRATLGESKVSTDADDLHGHGFSAIDHHPGTRILVIFGPAADVLRRNAPHRNRLPGVNGRGLSACQDCEQVPHARGALFRWHKLGGPVQRGKSKFHTNYRHV